MVFLPFTNTVILLEPYCGTITEPRLPVHRPHYSARLMSFESRGPIEFFSQIRHRNAFTEFAWEYTEQGLGMAMSTLASEKKRELLFTATCFTNSDISRCSFTSIPRERPPENRKF